MLQLKHLSMLLLASIFFVFALVLSGCNKSDSNPVGGGGSLDPLLVGVWWNSSAGSGVQIASDGTGSSLTSYAGKIAVDTSASAKSFTQKISASGGTGTYTNTGKWPPTGKDTTITGSFTYVLSNSNNTLSVTEKEDSVMVTTVYAKKNIGDASSGGGTTTNTLSITFDGTPYTMTANATAKHDTLDIIAAAAGGQMCEIEVMNQLGAQTIGTSIPRIFFLSGGATYVGTAGSVTITVISGLNTQGTFSVTMTSSTVTKSATGSFNVTR